MTVTIILLIVANNIPNLQPISSYGYTMYSPRRVALHLNQYLINPNMETSLLTYPSHDVYLQPVIPFVECPILLNRSGIIVIACLNLETLDLGEKQVEQIPTTILGIIIRITVNKPKQPHNITGELYHSHYSLPSEVYHVISQQAQ